MWNKQGNKAFLSWKSFPTNASQNHGNLLCCFFSFSHHPYSLKLTPCDSHERARPVPSCSHCMHNSTCKEGKFSLLLGFEETRSSRAVWLYTVASLGSSHRYQIDHICHLGGCWWFLCSKVLPKYFPLPKEIYAWNIHRQGPKGLWLVSPCKNACILQEIILLFFPSFFVDYWFWLFYSYSSLVHRLSARSLLS